jgi:hypothetical protein
MQRGFEGLAAGRGDDVAPQLVATAATAPTSASERNLTIP